MMKIKICGLFRDVDIDYINEARPDYTGFVFAHSRREISFAQAVKFRQHLAEGIAAAGVFVNSPIEDIAALYRDGVIDIAQLHGEEDEAYIGHLIEKSLKNKNVPIPVIKTIKSKELGRVAAAPSSVSPQNVNYYLLDSSAGSGKTFNWDVLKVNNQKAPWLDLLVKPWFLAGGINIKNIGEAMAINPFAIDVSSGAETDGVKDREKILQLTEAVREGSIP